MAIDVKPFVAMGKLHRALLGETAHNYTCELDHLGCAILFLAGALDNAQSMIEELLADRDRLRAQLESAQAWMPAWAIEEMEK